MSRSEPLNTNTIHCLGEIRLNYSILKFSYELLVVIELDINYKE